MSIPLVVDLDGTLISSDLLIESGLRFLRSSPLQLPCLLLWFVRGKAALKQGLAEAGKVDASLLPYNQEVLSLIDVARGSGRPIVLATASNLLLAQRVADYLGCFDAVMASDAQTNLSARTKCEALVKAFGDKGFDYAANSEQDIPVWAAARGAILVNVPAVTENRARQHGNVVSVIQSQNSSLADWFKAARLHQWLKNLLLFAPLFAAHLYTRPDLLVSSLLGFLCFGLCASGVYMLNDLLDLEDDRRHPSKKRRPFASGQLQIQRGLIVSPVLTGTSFLLAGATLPLGFSAAMLVYLLLTLAYSLWLKQRMVIDVIILAALYTIRIIAGALMIQVLPSFWLLIFSMFLFLSLALVKRYAELHIARANGHLGKAPGRGYFPSDLEMLASLGAASGYLSVLLLALYVNDTHTAELYSRPQLIWLACPLLLTWITRVWMLAHRGEMHDDPVLFAIHDQTSLCIAGLSAFVFVAAA